MNKLTCNFRFLKPDMFVKQQQKDIYHILKFITPIKPYSKLIISIKIIHRTNFYEIKNTDKNICNYNECFDIDKY